jgi:hypothetical protein
VKEKLETALTQHLETINPTRKDRIEVEPKLSQFFRSVLKEAWG